MADKNDSFLREIDEELQRERLAKLWDKYGIYAIAVLAAVVVGIGVYQYIVGQRHAAAEAAGAKFETAQQALAAGKADEAIKALEPLAQSGPGGYAALATLELAGAKATAGKSAEALAAYESLAGNPSADPLLRDYAKLQAAALRLGEADFTEIQNRLTDLAADGQPWRAPARELLGVAALKAGRLGEARTAFEALLADKNTPPSMMERARDFMTVIAAKEAGPASTKPDAAKTPDTGSAAASAATGESTKP